MKKLFLCLFILFLPFTVYANNYNLEDINIDLSEKWYVFTKDNIKNNQELKLLGVSEDYMNKLFENDIYRLDAVKFDNDDVVELFVITKDVNSINTFDMTDSQLNQLNNYYKNFVPSANVETFKTDYNNYIKAIYNDKNLNILDYYSTYNNVGYTIKIQRRNAFTEEEIKEYDEMIKNITFKGNKVINNKYEKKESVSYKIGYYVGQGAVIGVIVGLIVHLLNKKKNS